MPPGTEVLPVARQGRAIICPMTHDEFGGPDALACPHLGLAADPRTHFGVTADQVAMANRLAVTDGITAGARLVIPSFQHPRATGPTPDHRRANRFG